jgi:hypothetical protein
LIFMSLGGSLPFARKGVVARHVLPLSITLTVVGSALGALLLLRVPVRALQLTIAIAMIAVAGFSLVRKNDGSSDHPVSPARKATGYFATFILAVYGGFFSGGYVTMLTAVRTQFPAISGDHQGDQPVLVRRGNPDLRVAWRCRLQAGCHPRSHDVLGSTGWRACHATDQPRMAAPYLHHRCCRTCSENDFGVFPALRMVTRPWDEETP